MRGAMRLATGQGCAVADNGAARVGRARPEGRAAGATEPGEPGVRRALALALALAACAPAAEAEHAPGATGPIAPPPDGDRGACLAGRGDACERVAGEHVRVASPPGAPGGQPPGPAGALPAYDARRAADRLMFRTACETRGIAGACTALAMSMTPGEAAEAATLFARGCQGGSARGCALLGDAHAQGAGVTQDHARAAAFHAAACGWGWTDSCTALGESYAAGRGVPRDSVRAAALLSRACAGGVAEACGRARELRDASGDTAVAPPAAATTRGP
jgi:TPR repeat protein